MNNIANIVDMRTPIEIALNVDEDGNTTAKKLYAFLELNPANFSHWCKRNIIENEFATENEDFVRFVFEDETPTGGKIQREDYKLTAHFAKKLSVKGSGERAEQAREYFTTLEEKVKQKAIDYKQLSPSLQMAQALLQSQAEMELEQKRQAKRIDRIEKKQEVIVETFNAPTDTENFKMWVNKCIAQIAESKKFNKGGNRNYNYTCARTESYQRLQSKWNCHLDDRVQRAKGRALENNPSITKAQLNAINKLTVIAEDKTLKPIYETVIKEMMIAYCVDDEQKKTM